MNKLAAVLKLTRIEHSMMLAVAIIAAELISIGRLPSAYVLALSLITPFFVSMGAFAINDYFDIEADRANKRYRPLVTGALKPRDAIYITVVCLCVGVLAGYLLNLYEFAIALLFSLASVLYSYRLKEMFFWGNAYISLSAAIPFIFGAYAVTSSPGQAIFVLAAIGFLGNFAREIGGTIKDYEGDLKIRNARTIPIVIGKKNAALVSLLLYVITILLSAYLFLNVPPFKLNLVYGMPILLVDLMLLYVGFGYTLYDTRRFYDAARNISLAAMAIALAAFLLSALFLIPI